MRLPHIKPIKDWLKENWFESFVVVLLVMIYLRLGEIKENTFYTADMVDSSATRIINATQDYLSNIERNTENTWQILSNHF